MTDFVTRPSILFAPARQRRRAPLIGIVRQAAAAYLRARKRRRTMIELARLPDELLNDAGLLDHPEIVRARAQADIRRRHAFAAGDGGR